MMEDKHPLYSVNIKEVNISCWQHEDITNGNLFYTFSIKCSYYDKKEQCYKKSMGFTIQNLKDLSIAINLMIEQYYKFLDKNNNENFIRIEKI